MNTAIEMHDSECLAVEVDGQGSGFVVLATLMCIGTEGEHSVSPGEGGNFSGSGSKWKMYLSKARSERAACRHL